MAYGIQSWNADGTTVSTSPDILAGLFVGYYTTAFGTTTTYTYTDIPGGSYLRVVQIIAGGHTYSTGTNGSGQATLTVTTRGSNSLQDGATTLAVFSTLTTEPSYGINALNSNGDRTISTLYPNPEFLGKITFSTTPTYSSDLAEASYWMYSHNTTTSLGAGRNRIVLWSLPTMTNDVWFTGTSSISSYYTGSYTIECNVMCPSALAGTYVMPEAFVFAVNGLTSSGGYAAQVFDGAGNITFDSGRRHMQVKGFETVLGFPGASGTINTYASIASFSGSMPAFTIPNFSKEVWARIGSSMSSSGKYYIGGVRKTSSTQLDSKIIKSKSYYEDSIITSTVANGNSSALLQLVVDATLFDGSSGFPLGIGVTQSGGTAACTFDGAGTNNSYTCVSTSNWTATYSGGNTNSVSYAWSIVSNAGGLSITAGSTLATCTVSKTGTAPTSSTTTYSCTLRCTISQTGSSSVYVDKTVTHTSTDTYSPGGGGY